MLKEYNRVLVAVDGSDEAEKAFQKAVKYAMENQKHLVVVQVIPMSGYYYADNGVYFQEVMEKERESVSENMKEYIQKANAAGLTDVETLAELGDPKRMIAKEIPERENIDVIFIGATGLNALERVFLGSVSTYVVNHSTCDVVVVR